MAPVRTHPVLGGVLRVVERQLRRVDLHERDAAVLAGHLREVIHAGGLIATCPNWRTHPSARQPAFHDEEPGIPQPGLVSSYPKRVRTVKERNLAQHKTPYMLFRAPPQPLNTP